MNNSIFPASPSPLLLPGFSQPVIHTDFDGSKGTNRDWKNPCQLRAKHDFDAIHCWLNEYRHKATTYRTYQKEAERFLLWCVYQQKKPLSSVDREDLAAYIFFLDDPQPKEMWCAKPGGHDRKRGSVHWKPFRSALSPSAKATALSALDSLFNYLVQAHYLVFNPLGLIRKRHSSKKIPDQTATLQLQERILEVDEWHTMLDVLESFPETSPAEKKEKTRLKFIVTILYFLGLRIEELSTHTWGAFKKIDDQWWFFVIGKGSKLGKIPVNDALLREIIHYRNFLNKPPLPINNESTPLVHSFRTGNKITPRKINKLLKKLALETAKKYAHKPDKEKKLKKFSAHWLRHLSASMQDKVGMAFKHIRGNLRHENDETTRRYVHALDEDRYQDMQKLTLRVPLLSTKQST
jgi:integrase/recombinase XerD